MLKILLKKQLMEVFRGYFYDAKKNKKRSPVGIALFFIMFVGIMVGVLGGMFTYISLNLCAPLTAAGVGWLYFMLMSLIAIALGAFGSVFNTYAGLYLSKDNDLLLSMPIPLKDIIASRLLNVYLMGVMYSSVVIIPATVVYWVVGAKHPELGVHIGPAEIVCGIILMLIISLIVLILSCLLGWCVARISLKTKNKSFTTVFLSICFIIVYYLAYFKASDLLRNMVENAALYGEKIKGAAYGLYMFGAVGTGDILPTVIYTVAILALTALTWIVLRATFLSIAIDSGKTEKKKYKEKPVKVRSIGRAILSKEFARFTSSPTYMLNCGMGILMIPVFGVVLLATGDRIMNALIMVFGESHYANVLMAAAMFLLIAMNTITVPSVSLEGKTLWQYQSIPVSTKQILRIKNAVGLILTGIPALFALVCMMVVARGAVIEKIMVCLVTVAFVFFSTSLGTFLGTVMPNLTWTNEMVPVKQSGSLAIAMFGDFGIAVIMAVIYMVTNIPSVLGIVGYLGIWTAVFAAASVVFMIWLDREGAKRLAEM